MADHPRQPSAPKRSGQARSGPKRSGPPRTPRTHASPPPPETASERAPSGGQDGERVAKALARSGVASRREVERLIAEGRVALNGQVLETPAVKIGASDVMTVDGRAVAEREPTRLWRYHKPTGLVTSNNDPQGRPTVFQALPPGLPRVISIGRLDLNSEGLLLLTNDGELARALELPSSGWLRRYRVRAYGRITQDRLDGLKDGVTVDGVVYGAIEARLDKVQHRAGEGREGPANVWITVGLSEGKNREVRRVLEHLGLKVNRLIRLAYGPFALNVLPVGAVEEVGPRVIREQLRDFIAPENLPTGSLVKGGVQLGGPPHAGAPRRSQPGVPAAKQTVEAAEPEAKKVYKAGWAKPKPRSPGGKPPGGKPTHAPNRARGAAYAGSSGRDASPYRATLGPRTRAGAKASPTTGAVKTRADKPDKAGRPSGALGRLAGKPGPGRKRPAPTSARPKPDGGGADKGRGPRRDR